MHLPSNSRLWDLVFGVPWVEIFWSPKFRPGNFKPLSVPSVRPRQEQCIKCGGWPAPCRICHSMFLYRLCCLLRWRYVPPEFDILCTCCTHCNVHWQLKLMCSFCRTSAYEEVPDPYYGGPQGFETVSTQLDVILLPILLRVANNRNRNFKLADDSAWC